MPAFTYYSLGANKRLNEIVLAGSHDAGIGNGGDNAKTQSTDIAGQADAGVRIFDVRVALATTPGQVKGTVGKLAELKTFHAGDILVTSAQKTRDVAGLGMKTLERSKLRGGVWGQGLQGILQQAAAFVGLNTTEFLILKFDHCSNWEAIAELCVRELGDKMYTAGGNLNTKTLQELQGRVICLFAHSAYVKLDRVYKNLGILGINNLQKGGAYVPNYEGLQYFGKGGTDLVMSNTWKITFWAKSRQTSEQEAKTKENEKKQKKLMEKAGKQDPNVMGMMYWTSTGVLGSIEKRNDYMWQKHGQDRLTDLWEQGAKDIVGARAPANVDLKTMAGGAVIKHCMPNFVMIDFADAPKCQYIFGLNYTPAVSLVQAAQG